MLLKWFSVVGVTIILVGLYLVGAFGSKYTRAAQPSGEPQTVIVQPSATAIPSPTLDIQATKMVQQTELTNAQAELARVNLEIEQTNLAIQESREREAAAIAAAAQSEVDKSSNNLRIVEEQNKQIALNAEIIKLENEKLALENYATELEIKRIEAEAAARNGWLVLAGFLGLGGGMVLGGRYLSKAPRKAEIQPEQSKSQTVAKSWNKTSNGSGATWHAIAPPLEVDAFRSFAEYALSGGLLGINNVCDKSGIVSRSDYAKHIIPWMQEHDYYGRDSESGGLVLNESGQKDFLTWLRDNPPPLLENLSQIMPPTDHNHENHDHERPENAEGEGGEDE